MSSKQIAVEIVAKHQQFESGMQSAAQSVTKFSSVAAGAAAAVTHFALELAGKAVSAMADYAKKSFEVADANAKLADSLGTTVQGLRQLKYAGDLAGVSGEEMGNALTKMQKAVADNEDVFGRLGLSTGKLIGEDATQQFNDIAKAIKSIKSPAEQTKAAMDVFGKSGAQLLPLINSTDDFASVAAELDAIGGAMSRVDASKIEGANDAFTRIKTVAAGIGDTIATEVSPYITQAIQDLIDFGFTSDNVGAIFKEGFTFAVSVVAQLTDTFSGLQSVAYLVASAGSYVAHSFVAAFTDILNLAGKVASFFSDDLANAIYELYGKSSMMNQKLLESTKNYYDKAGKAAEDFTNGAASKAATDWMAKAQNNAQKKGLEAQHANSERRKAAYESAVNEGFTEGLFGDIIEGWKKQDAEAEKARQGWERFADQIKQSIVTPFEKFSNLIDKINEAQMQGLLTQEQADLAKKNAVSDIVKQNTQEFKMGFGHQLDTSHVSSEALRMADNKVQKVTDPKALELLKQIRDKMSNGSGVVRAT